MDLILDVLSVYTITDVYGSICLTSPTYARDDRVLYTTKLRSDLAGTFATAIFPRLIEA